jgi:hypothetical protein
VRPATRFALVVLVVALWPLAHRALVLRYRANPWKLGGFAMYASYETQLSALFRVTGQGFQLVDEAGLAPEGRAAFARFRARRAALGRLVRPDAAVRAIHAGRPELGHLVVVVQRLWLDPASARIAQEKDTYLYEAGAPVP